MCVGARSAARAASAASGAQAPISAYSGSVKTLAPSLAVWSSIPNTSSGPTPSATWICTAATLLAARAGGLMRGSGHRRVLVVLDQDAVGRRAAVGELVVA